MNTPTAEIFLPCRAGSERVPHKNTRRFADHGGGLLERKLQQLEAITFADRVVVDSNDPEVLAAGDAYRKHWSGKADLIVRERPDILGRSDTTTDTLIQYALEHALADVLAWTHVTSPFADAAFYQRAWTAFIAGQRVGHDSLMSVTPLRGFLWSTNGPVNYVPSPVRWPRTQDLQPFYDVNSAIFMVPTDLGRRRQDRIGVNPVLFESSSMESVDIDWPEDFEMAEFIAKAATANGRNS